MIDMTLIKSFLGWCAVINIGFLLFSTIFLIVFGQFTLNIHSRFFNINRERLDTLYFQFLANYKMIIIVLNITPFMALYFMGY